MRSSVQSRTWIVVAASLLALTAGAACGAEIAATAAADTLVHDFLRPPASARPWVYWFWLNGNITRNGITADLESMHRVGIGGVLIMEVDQGAPSGPVGFMGEPMARAVQARRRRGRPAGPGSEHEQRCRLERQRRPVGQARAIDAEGRRQRDQGRRPQEHRGIAAAAADGGRLLSRHRRVGLSHAGQLSHSRHRGQGGLQGRRRVPHRHAATSQGDGRSLASGSSISAPAWTGTDG